MSWKSNLHAIVALFTIKVEYAALTEAIKEALWLDGISKELGLKNCVPKVFCDSQSAIHLSKNSVFHKRTKHIDLGLYFVRDVIVEQQVVVEKISTKVNPIDMLTKSIPATKFEQALSLLRILPA